MRFFGRTFVNDGDKGHIVSVEFHSAIGEQGVPDMCRQDYGVEFKECDVIALPLARPGTVEPVVAEYRAIVDTAR